MSAIKYQILAKKKSGGKKHNYGFCSQVVYKLENPLKT